MSFDFHTKKVYNNLIEPFKGAILGNNIVQEGLAIPDIWWTDGVALAAAAARVVNNWGNRGDPQPNCILLKSLSLILNQILYSTNKEGKASFIALSYSELTDYVKEKLKMNLPIFETLFDEFYKILEFFKNIINTTRINLSRQSLVDLSAVTSIVIAATEVVNIAGAAPRGQRTFPRTINEKTFRSNTFTAGLSTREMKNILNQLINNLMSQTKGLKLNIVKVSSETQDDVTFMDNKEFLFDFPTLKPVSSITTFLRGNSLDFMPCPQVGTFTYILLRGVSKALFSCKYKTSNKFVLEQIKMVNSLIRKRFTILALTTFPETYVAPNLKSYSGLVTTTVDDVVALSTNKEEVAIRTLAGVLSNRGLIGGTDREIEQIFNVIDLNLNPINIHSLVRSMPLATVYNYCYTFEQVVCSLFGLAYDDIELLDIEQDGAAAAALVMPSSKSLFVKLLMNPYSKMHTLIYGGDIFQKDFIAPMQQIFRGDINFLSFSTFLGEQLFNKTLFGSLYLDHDNTGLLTSTGVLKGRFYGQRAAVNEALGDELTLAFEIKNRPITTEEMESLNIADANQRWVNYIAEIKALAQVVEGRRRIPNGPKALLVTLIADVGVAGNPAVAGAGISDIINFEPKPVGGPGDLDPNFAANLVILDGHVDVLYNAIKNCHTALNPAGAAPDPAPVALGANTLSALAKNLTYLGTPANPNQPWSAVKIVSLSYDEKRYLAHMGFDRFNTTLVRNLIFLTNLQRIISLKLGQRIDEDHGTILKNGFSALYSNS